MWVLVRNDIRLHRAMNRIDLLHSETEELYRTATLSPHLCELRNLITIGLPDRKGAQFRKESRDCIFNTDYPHKSALLQQVVL